MWDSAECKEDSDGREEEGVGEWRENGAEGVEDEGGRMGGGDEERGCKGGGVPWIVAAWKVCDGGVEVTVRGRGGEDGAHMSKRDVARVGE